eukprot:TRINITY_DN3069_c0_g2_i1.p1 TRINITY_DN3069_c0_g2~~TRINITY_DN3069_c0_g2_i1.p1  ORF type:complete len:515 (+),score=66.17 TRINITY_DN3069_c0_g2_i1:164-1546(+)
MTNESPVVGLIKASEAVKLSPSNSPKTRTECDFAHSMPTPDLFCPQVPKEEAGAIIITEPVSSIEPHESPPHVSNTANMEAKKNPPLPFTLQSALIAGAHLNGCMSPTLLLAPTPANTPADGVPESSRLSKGVGTAMTVPSVSPTTDRETPGQIIIDVEPSGLTKVHIATPVGLQKKLTSHGAPLIPDPACLLTAITAVHAAQEEASSSPGVTRSLSFNSPDCHNIINDSVLRGENMDISAPLIEVVDDIEMAATENLPLSDPSTPGTSPSHSETGSGGEVVPVFEAESKIGSECNATKAITSPAWSLDVHINTPLASTSHEDDWDNDEVIGDNGSGEVGNALLEAAADIKENYKLDELEVKLHYVSNERSHEEVDNDDDGYENNDVEDHYFEDETTQYEMNFGSSERYEKICGRLAGLSMGPSEPLRGIPSPKGIHIRFPDSDDNVESTDIPSNGNLLA